MARGVARRHRCALARGAHHPRAGAALRRAGARPERRISSVRHGQGRPGRVLPVA